MKPPLKTHFGLPGQPLCKEPRARFSSHWPAAITCKRCLHFLSLGMRVRWQARWPELSYAWRNEPIDTSTSWPPWLAPQDNAD